jgi:hypothetical protein
MFLDDALAVVLLTSCAEDSATNVIVIKQLCFTAVNAHKAKFIPGSFGVADAIQLSHHRQELTSITLTRTERSTVSTQ